MLRKYVIHNTRDVTWVEESYGLGYQAGLKSDRYQHNPYDDPKRNLAWQKGYREGQTKSKLRSNYRKGEIRNKRFERPAQHDFKSERGYQAVIMSSTGGVVTKSPPFLRELGAQRWASRKIEEAIKKGFRVSSKVLPGFFDPWQLQEEGHG